MAVTPNDMIMFVMPRPTNIYGRYSTPKRAKKSASMAVPPSEAPSAVRSITPIVRDAMRSSPGFIERREERRDMRKK
jgi:hypothetical protein